jgi:hypothetical protein
LWAGTSGGCSRARLEAASGGGGAVAAAAAIASGGTVAGDIAKEAETREDTGKWKEKAGGAGAAERHTRMRFILPNDWWVQAHAFTFVYVLHDVAR